jgi:hypothetical protein
MTVQARPVTRWFYDTEFSESPRGTIELISIAFVNEDGREYYACSTDHDPADAPPWVVSNVLPHLPKPSDQAWKSRARIAVDLEELLLADHDDIELWAWMGAYDHVVLCQLWGQMPALPRRLPRFTRELRQHWELLGSPSLPAQAGTRHDALADARHNLVRWRTITAGSVAGAPRSPRRG